VNSFLIVLKQCGQFVRIFFDVVPVHLLDARLRHRLIEILVAEPARGSRRCNISSRARHAKSTPAFLSRRANA